MEWKATRWNSHPGVRTESDLSLGERAADIVRNGMGSWAFVFSFIAAMIGWAVYNSYVATRVEHGHGFDPYPYILLNLMLSTMAGLQGAILLIAAKRADQVSSELAQHDLEADQDSQRMLKALTEGFGNMYTQHQAMAEQMNRLAGPPESK